MNFNDCAACLPASNGSQATRSSLQAKARRAIRAQRITNLLSLSAAGYAGGGKQRIAVLTILKPITAPPYLATS